jgi:hypothetical protein
LDLEILRQFSMHFVIANSPTWLIRSSWNFVHCKILIWRCEWKASPTFWIEDFDVTLFLSKYV